MLPASNVFVWLPGTDENANYEHAIPLLPGTQKAPHIWAKHAIDKASERPPLPASTTPVRRITIRPTPAATLPGRLSESVRRPSGGRPRKAANRRPLCHFVVCRAVTPVADLNEKAFVAHAGKITPWHANVRQFPR